LHHLRHQCHLSSWGVLLVIVALSHLLTGCETSVLESLTPPTCAEQLDQPDIEDLIAQAVEVAVSRGQNVSIAITNREGDTLAIFAMTDSQGDPSDAVDRARTAAYLSSNQHAFTSLTACFITRNHFPPGVSNTPGGPLFGVSFSQLSNSDIQPNGATETGRPGLVGNPGGVPVYKNGCLVGGIGISGGEGSFEPAFCAGQTEDEVIALQAVNGYEVPPDKRGDNIFIDGIRFLYANASPPTFNFSAAFDVSSLGAYLISPQPGPSSRYPDGGYVSFSGHDFTAMGGSVLTQADVDRIIQQAVAQAARTRAAIRRPLGVPAQVFIAVVDVNGSVLGVWRTSEATIFSFDVSVQKARTAAAFSNPNMQGFGDVIRSVLNISAPNQLAITTRAIGFLAQDFFPPGIDRDTLGMAVQAGPLFGLQNDLSATTSLPPSGNGITIFPGGIPLYKNGQLAGAIGVSGDGVDQDDLIAFAGTIGFEAPEEIRCDMFFYKSVRLPFVKFPRSPEIP